jgi:gluconate 2-dehydrogenase
MRVLITRPLPDRVIGAARARFDVTVRPETSPLSQGDMVASLSGYDAVLPTLGDLYRAEVFAAVPAPRCRLLANFGVGYNHIDVGAARAAGIAVTNTPGAVTDATADIGMMLALMSARRASEGERLVRAGKWEGWHPTQLLGLHLSGKTMGIVGMGRIGKAIAKRAQLGFGMEIVFFNRSPVVDTGVPARQLATLAEVMASSDFVVVAVPAGPATRHIVGREALAEMRPHAHLVNISRGDTIDEDALIEALTARRIGGAGLDVYEREPVVPEALLRLDNVTLLPHLGTAALEVRENMGMMAVANLVAFAEGKPLPNPV